MKKQEKTKYIHFGLKEEEHHFIHTYALEKRVTVKQLMLDALAYYMMKESKKQ